MNFGCGAGCGDASRKKQHKCLKKFTHAARGRPPQIQAAHENVCCVMGDDLIKLCWGDLFHSLIYFFGQFPSSLNTNFMDR